jgi:hypothetical protein
MTYKMVIGNSASNVWESLFQNFDVATHKWLAKTGHVMFQEVGSRGTSCRML